MDQFTPLWVLLVVTISGAAVSRNETFKLNERGFPQIPKDAHEMIHATLPFVLRSAGLIECQGANPQTAGNFFGQILGDDINYNKSSYLCGPTCEGKCVPRPADVGIPSDNFPYGCLCSACDLNGPKVAPMANPYFKMTCRPDTRCTCFGMGPGQFIGYSCNWKNTLSGLPITFTEKSVLLPGASGRPPVVLRSRGTRQFSPIRWCSCCPHLPAM